MYEKQTFNSNLVAFLHNMATLKEYIHTYSSKFLLNGICDCTDVLSRFLVVRDLLEKDDSGSTHLIKKPGAGMLLSRTCMFTFNQDSKRHTPTLYFDLNNNLSWSSGTSDNGTGRWRGARDRCEHHPSDAGAPNTHLRFKSQ